MSVRTHGIGLWQPILIATHGEAMCIEGAGCQIVCEEAVFARNGSDFRGVPSRNTSGTGPRRNSRRDANGLPIQADRGTSTVFSSMAVVCVFLS